jgi:hypothetical protein
LLIASVIIKNPRNLKFNHSVVFFAQTIARRVPAYGQHKYDYFNKPPRPY